MILFGLFVSPFVFSQLLSVNSSSSISIALGNSILQGSFELTLKIINDKIGFLNIPTNLTTA
jgi:hypothetical protein